jgi:hypothetical protein
MSYIDEYLCSCVTAPARNESTHDGSSFPHSPSPIAVNSHNCPCQSITDELRETECLDQHHDDIDCQSRVPQTPVCNPPNKPQTRVVQETVRACARLRLILARPELYIATVFHARCLLTVVSQVPVFNFCEHFMSITNSIMSVCSLLG